MLPQFDLLRYWSAETASRDNEIEFAGFEGLKGMKVDNIPVRHGVIMWASGRLPRTFVLRYWASVLGDDVFLHVPGTGAA